MPLKLAYGLLTVSGQQDVIPGASFVEDATTASRYRLFDLDGFPVLVEDPPGGHSIAVQVWEIPDDAWQRIVDAEPPEMVYGGVELQDGRSLPTMLGTPEFVASRRGTDVSEYGSWAAFLRERHGRAAPGTESREAATRPRRDG